MTKAELQAKRAAKLAAAKALLEANPEMSAEHTAQFDALRAEAADFKAQIEAIDAREAMAAELDDELADLEAVPAPRSVAKNSRTPRANVRDRREDDPKRGFANFGDFGNAVAAASRPGVRMQDERLLIGATAQGLEQGVGANGGFTVPPAYATTIWDGMNAAPDNLLGRTDQYTVEGESLTFNANAETSRATGSRYGGVQGYWIAEADQITKSKPTFRQMKLEPSQLAVLVYATEKLLKNSAVALDQYLTRAATEEISFLVGDSIVNGTGVGKPKGILASAARVAVAKETGQTAATIVYANIVKMWSRLHARSRAGAVWYVNQDIEPQLALLTMPVGTGGVPVYLPPGGASASPFATLFGRPIIPIEYCPTLGTEGDIILADLKAYASGTQGGVESAMSMHLRFDYAEMAFRFMFAVDGQPWLAAPITPFKGSNTTSPFVTLASRA